jgi:hypothetical protein
MSPLLIKIAEFHAYRCGLNLLEKFHLFPLLAEYFVRTRVGTQDRLGGKVLEE